VGVVDLVGYIPHMTDGLRVCFTCVNLDRLELSRVAVSTLILSSPFWLISFANFFLYLATNLHDDFPHSISCVSGTAIVDFFEFCYSLARYSVFVFSFYLFYGLVIFQRSNSPQTFCCHYCCLLRRHWISSEGEGYKGVSLWELLYGEVENSSICSCW